MNIQELKDFFIASEYSDETKKVIAQILSDKVEATPEVIFQIKEILQKELDADFEELGIDITGDPEAEIIEKEYAEELDLIEKDLDNDMEFVEKELNELEEIRKQVLKISDEIEGNK